MVVRGGLVFKAHRLLYHFTLGSRVIKEKRRRALPHDGLQPLGQDKPAFGWELEPLWPLLLYRAVTFAPSLAYP